MKRKNRIYPIIIISYLILIFPLISFRYARDKDSMLEWMDRTLYMAASNLEFFLPPDFHDKYNPENPLDNERYQMIKNRLNHYVENMGIEYIYSLVKRGDSVYFVISNETEEDVARGTPSLFYNPYPDPPQDLLDAFETRKIVKSSSYSNLWDNYYSIFIPRITRSGQLFILAADIKMENQKALMKKSALPLLLMILFLVAPIIVFMVLISFQSKNREKILLDQLYTDQLTGLPNRNKFILDKDRGSGSNVSAIMLDIDSFHDINNLFGGKVGDHVLSYTADLIRRSCQEEDLLYKFPADEFVLLVPCGSRIKLVEQCEKIFQAFSEASFVTKGQSLNLTLSAGLVHCPGSQRKLLSSANIAKNQAKKDRKGYVLYQESMNLEEQYSKNYYWLNTLKHALLDRRIVPFYQPIYNNRTGEIKKYEALCRLIDEEGTVLNPDKFLPVAKKSKLYKQITHAMVERSFQDFSEKPHVLSINMTVQDLLDKDTVAFLLRKVKEYGMENRVVVELVESESLFEIHDTSSIFNRFRNCGIGIAIDDFGSGYSNFSYMSSIPMDYLKIDGSLIRDILNNKSSEAVVTAISAFSRDLGIPLIAEFVPCGETLEKLIGLGVAYSQGFYIGKPQPIEKLQEIPLFVIDKDDNRL